MDLHSSNCCLRFNCSSFVPFSHKLNVPFHFLKSYIFGGYVFCIFSIPKTTSKFDDLLGGLNTQCVVTPTATRIYSKRIQSKVSKEKRCMRWSPEETRCKFPAVHSCAATQAHLIPQVGLEGQVEWCAREAYYRFGVQGCYLGWLCRHTLCLICPNIPDS